MVTLNLQVLPNLTSNFSVQTCQGESFTFGGNSYSASGNYTAILTAQNGCDSTVTLNLQVLLNIFSFFEYAKCNGDTVFFEGTAYTDFGLYEVIWLNGNSCYSTVQILISEAEETTCKPIFCNAYVPNAFSPNFDGINDLFMGNSQEVSFNELFIFERWGELVHYVFGESPKWDGSFRG